MTEIVTGALIGGLAGVVVFLLRWCGDLHRRLLDLEYPPPRPQHFDHVHVATRQGRAYKLVVGDDGDIYREYEDGTKVRCP